jgi:phosphate:Na+ symporter
MVIGMDVGTTFTAALATIGGSTASRQTGYGQVVYNVLTGIMAFFLLVPFAGAVEEFIASGGAGNAQVALVSFHTLFNTIGVVLVLPFAGLFARLIERLVPERGPPLLRNLDDRLLHDPASAVAAAAATVREIAARLTGIVCELLGGTRPDRRIETGLRAVVEALEATRVYLGRIRTQPEQELLHGRHLAAVHALDHLIRLAHRCSQTTRIEMLQHDPELRELSGLVHDEAGEFLHQDDLETVERQLDSLRARLTHKHYEYRESTVEKAAQQLVSPDTTLRRLDAIRWLHRVTYHFWRIIHHLRQTAETGPAVAEAVDVETIIEEDL